MAGPASDMRAAMGVAALALAFLPPTGLAAQTPSNEAATEAPLQLHFVDNFTQTFAVPPEFLWAELKRMYVNGNKYRDLGFVVEMISPTPEAPLGGTTVSRNADGVVDRRTALFTIIDDDDRFLALRVVYTTGVAAQVSYDVREAPGGSLVQLIVHAQQTMDGTKTVPMAEEVRREAERLTVFHYAELAEMWAAEARRIEALYGASAPHKN